VKGIRAAIGVLVALSAPASAEEVVLKFATLNMATAHLNANIHHPFAKRVNEQGAGAVKIEVYDGPTLATQANFYDRVVNDVAQLSWGLHIGVAGKFPLSEVAGLPFLTETSEPASVAYWRLYKSGLLDSEYDQIVPLYVNAFPQTSLHLAKAPRTIDTLQGLRVIGGGRIFSECLARLDAAPLSLSLGQAYEAIQRGVADGVAIQWTGFQPFKLVEVTRYHVDGSFGASTGMIFMAKKRYEGLPEAARKIIEANGGEKQSRDFGVFWDKVQNGAREEVRAMKDHTIVALTSEQDKRWRERLAPVTTEWLAQGPERRRVYDKFRELLAEASKR
jgi:TRAP-type C4-dicarboxylate transport system substrate-binding protein